MSYIRCTSNPEGLYIFGSSSGVEIYQDQLPGKIIPYHIWNGFFKRYFEEFSGFWKHDNETKCDYGSYRGFRVGEMWEKEDTHNLPKIYMRYKDWKIVMWPVTFYYIEHNVENTLYGPRKIRRKKVAAKK